MGTRGGIARIVGKSGFRGVYHHWDSYPSGLGEQLWSLYHGFFKGDLKRMLRFLINEHPAGWSTICNKDFSLKAGYVDMNDPSYREDRRPQCYCHGSRHKKAHVLTDKNASGSGVEYVYAFDEKTNTMYILSSYIKSGAKMIGFFGAGDPNAEWRAIAAVDLNGAEPNWKMIEASAR